MNFNTLSFRGAITAFSKQNFLPLSASIFILVSGPAQADDTFDTTDASNEWSTNTELMYQNRHHSVALRALMPMSQDNNSLSYFDGRFIHSEDGIREGNLGLGKRWIIDDQAWIAGLYGAFDLRRSGSGRDYRQLTTGVEALSDKYDLIANYYYPMTDKQLLGTADSGGFFFRQ